MRGNVLWICCFLALLSSGATRPVSAQQEEYHPGESYDSLDGGRDADADAEAQRRALIGRQIMIEEQVMLQNTWADPQDRYRPVHPESFGPVRPKVYIGPTLADVYANPGRVVYYGGTSAPVATGGWANSSSSPPMFQPWPRVPNDIWGTPYYGTVRQPIGHVKIWTGRLSYIYKPVYASPPVESPPPVATSTIATTRRPFVRPKPPVGEPPVSTERLNAPPPPPKPLLLPPAVGEIGPGAGPAVNPPQPMPPRAGQEL